MGVLVRPGTERIMTTILIADDNVDMLELIADSLEMNGFEVLKAINGDEAWNILNTLEAVCGLVVLSDVRMPKLDGFGLLARVRGSERWPHIPFMLMSGDFTDQARALAAHADDFVLKPFRVEALQAKLETIAS